MDHSHIFKVIIFLSLSLLSIEGFPQKTTTSPIFISLNYRSGENVPHREIIMNLGAPYRGVDIKLGWQTTGRKDWQSAYRYPSLGVGVNWNTFKTEILGEPVALYFFTNFPQISTRRFRLDVEANFGFSYGINPYNEITNPANFSTGSKVNSLFGLYLEQSFHLNPQFDLFVCEGISHYSNGALGWPNLGLNIPSLKIGARYLFEKPVYMKTNEKPIFKKNLSIVTYLGCGTKKMFAPTPSYNEVLISPSLFYRTGFKRRVGVGLEVAYNESVIGTDFDRKFKFEELLTFAAHLSHEFIIDRFTILSQFGIYLKNSPSVLFYYERVGLGYYLMKNVRIVLNVKAHYIKAEYIEAGLCYDLNFK